jgi:rhodanese-related sulfurtransferase
MQPNTGSTSIEVPFNELSINGDIVIDCRSITEFEIAHLQDAINIPLQHLSLLQDSFPCKKDDVFYVYCRTGNRSCTFVTYLRSIGYSNCQSIAGGFELWGTPPSC